MSTNYVKTFVFIAVMNFGIAMFISVLSAYFPAQMFPDGDQFQENQANLEAFAGDLAFEYNPYILYDVRSPGYWKYDWMNPIPVNFRDGDPVGRDRYYTNSTYGEIGIVNPQGVYLDPSQKSSQRLGNNYAGQWTHTGYRYAFAPSDDARRDQIVNIIWYKHGLYEQGLEAGLDISLFDKRLDYLQVTEIVSGYDSDKQIGEYKFSLGDRSVYVLLIFDVNALALNGGDYYKTFDEGGWSMNVAQKALLDPDDYSPGMLDAALSILQMNNPNIPGQLNIILFLMVTVPTTVVVVLFIRDFFRL